MPGLESDSRRGQPPEGRDSHGERRPEGWRVRPGPDGRGGPPPSGSRLAGSGFLAFFLLLIVLNIVLMATLHGATVHSRVRFP